jgi:hypothetical protein
MMSRLLSVTGMLAALRTCAEQSAFTFNETSWLLKYKNTPHPPDQIPISLIHIIYTNTTQENIKDIQKQSPITYPKAISYNAELYPRLLGRLDKATDFGSPKKCCSLESFNKNTHHIQSNHVDHFKITFLPFISLPIEAKGYVGHANILPRSHCAR